MTAVKSWIEISGARLVENLRAVQAIAGAETEVLAVVKANGYGHDATLVAGVLADAGLRWLGVSDVEEGARVRAAVGDSLRILVMCGMESGDATVMLAHGLTPVVWTADHIDSMEAAAQQAVQHVGVHLEIDTGMSRQGVPLGPELEKMLKRLADSQWVRCEGVMSHLSSAEVAGSPVTEQQRQKFSAVLERVVAAGLTPEWVHLGNTSAVDEGSTTKWLSDTAKRLRARAMVRTGLALYGYTLPVEGAAPELGTALKPVMQWKTRVIDLREVATGTTVGYGATFVAPQPLRLALLPVGYADGFRREASSGMGNGWVMVAGKRAAVVGRVSMNLTTVDVTALDVAVGDEVVLLGERVTAEDHARWSKTIAYDILCGIKARPQLT